MSSSNGARKWRPINPEYTPSAAGTLRKIAKVYGKKQAKRITTKFEEFAKTGRGDITIYRKIEKGLELRIGRFRAILQISDGTIRMIAVGMKKTRKI